MTWREGTKGKLSGKFAWVRVWPAQGWAEGGCAGAEPIWLLIEEQADGKIQFAFSNLPADTSRLQAVRLWKSRWPVEQGYQQMKEELGLNHFEGRSWRGFHHHACLVMLAYGFLALEQLREKEAPASPGSKSEPGPRITVPAIRRALQRLLRPLAKPDCELLQPISSFANSTIPNLNGVVLGSRSLGRLPGLAHQPVEGLAHAGRGVELIEVGPATIAARPPRPTCTS